jgi:hypothetical protein
MKWPYWLLYDLGGFHVGDVARVDNSLAIYGRTCNSIETHVPQLPDDIERAPWVEPAIAQPTTPRRSVLSGHSTSFAPRAA